NLRSHICKPPRCERRALTRAAPRTKGLRFLDLREIQLHGRRASQDLHRHLQAVLLVVDVLDDSIEVVERTVDHAHDLAGLEEHLPPRLVPPLLPTTPGLTGLPFPYGPRPFPPS